MGFDGKRLRAAAILFQGSLDYVKDLFTDQCFMFSGQQLTAISDLTGLKWFVQIPSDRGGGKQPGTVRDITFSIRQVVHIVSPEAKPIYHDG